ncbi:MAG: hypothetical protein SGJ21_11835 [Alphaproteobacteria bacterium]|nr:hypothetical protein [Alphaproteobacteria bacterium]
MENNLASGGRQIVEGLLPLYRDTNFAYGVAVSMFLLAALLGVIAVVRHVLIAAAIRNRQRQLTGFIAFETGGEDLGTSDPQEIQFARRFREIDSAMQQPGLTASALRDAWRRYRKTFSFVSVPPIRSTQRPNGFFYGAVPPPTWLGFAANMFIGFGLLATFLGLVAALTFAAEGMRGSDSGAMQDALRDLLAAASSKFVTSIAGVGLSILLNILERFLVVDLRRNLDALCGAIELGVRVDSDAHSAAVAERLGRLAAMLEGAAPTAAIATRASP